MERKQEALTHASLFSGIGGFDYAAESIGWKNLFWCEIDPFCQTVLKYHFTHAKGYSDIRGKDFTTWRGKITVLSGGFPCQPFSQAGKRRGTDDERYLWPAMLGAIRQIRPRWVVGENVYGIINWNAGMVFDQVCIDLESEGYEVQPFVLPACGVNAPHQRYRTFFVAYSNHSNDLRNPGEYESEDEKQWLSQRHSFRELNQSDILRKYPGTDTSYDVTNPERFRRNKVCADLQPQKPNGKRACDNGGKWNVAHSDNTGGIASRGEAIPDRSADSQQWKNPFFGTCGYSEQDLWEFAERIARKENEWGRISIIDWLNFPTQSPICRGDDGLSQWLDTDTVFNGVRNTRQAKPYNRWRQESVKAYGNAVVPPLVLQIFKAIDRFERLYADYKLL